MDAEHRFRALRLEELTTHDVYEFAPVHAYDPEHCTADSFWHPEYLYLEDEEWGIDVLADALNTVFAEPPGFGWYGDTRVSLEQWAEVERLTLAAYPGRQDVEEFFSAVRHWLESGSRDADYFWILGP